jgi:serine/threonine protein kinase
MSPQITAAKMQNGKTTYDGTKADIWAMGVLLCVCLIGKFPFEGDSVSTMGVSDPMKKIYHQQHKSTWSANSLLQDQLPYLSPEVHSLLDQMFEVDEAKRIDIGGIKAHPWFNKPITTPALRDECAKIEEAQTVIEKKAATGAYRSKTRDAAISNLIKMAASEEFRKRATEPVTEETTFEVSASSSDGPP